jgi:hypothetical protein
MSSGEPATATMNLRGLAETLRLTGLAPIARPAAVGRTWIALYVTQDRAFAVHLESRVVAIGEQPGSTAEAATLTLLAGTRTIERLQVRGYCF